MVQLVEQTYELVAVDDLQPHPNNPRRGKRDVIAESLEENGFYGAVIAQRSTGYILIGNHRYEEARAKGAEKLPCLLVDVDDDRARRIMLIDNRSSDLAGYDNAALAEVLELVAESTGGTVGTGYAAADVAEVLAAVRKPASHTDPDDAPEKPKKPRSKVGDVWLLGEHRLVCGDSTDEQVLRRALDDEPAAMLFTDPPYGVKYEGGTADKLTIANDDLTASQLAEELLLPAFGAAQRVLAPGGAYYVCSPSGALETVFRLSLNAAELPIRQQIVWVKNAFVLGHSDYHLQHETIFYGWQVGDDPLVPPHFDPEHETLLYGWKEGAGHRWEGGRKQSTVWNYDRPRRSAIHPTMKPVDLVRRAVENNTRPGGLVLDSFAGSGSTLIACHLAGRRAALVELDPKYVDVICRRYEEHSGVVPVLERTGKPVSFAA